MTSLAIGGGGVHTVEYGTLDGNAMRFAQVLNDYDPYFQLEFIPERDRGGEAPYRVINTNPSFPKHVVRYITHEEMLQPQKVLAAIWKGDTRHHSADSILRDMELEEAAARLINLKKREEALAETEEMMAFFAGGGRDKKHYMRHNGQVIER